MESIAPSSKTTATTMIVAPWEQKAQWKQRVRERGTHRGTDRRRKAPRKKMEDFQIQLRWRVKQMFTFGGKRTKFTFSSSATLQEDVLGRHPIHRLIGIA